MASTSATCQRSLAVTLALISGGSLPMQSAVNSALGNTVLSLPLAASDVNFGEALAIVSIVAMTHRPNCGDLKVHQAPWYAFTGGVIGCIPVVMSIYLAEPMGLVSFQMCFVVGQLVSSLVCDAIGLLHLQKRKPTAARVLVLVATVVAAGLASSHFKIGVSPQRFALFGSIVAFGGISTPVVACVNAAMGKFAGTPFRAVVVHFSGGLVVLLVATGVAALASGQRVEVISGGQPWMWTGGLLGAAKITCNTIGIPLIGAAAYMTVLLAAQLTMALIFDTIGAFNMAPIPPSPMRVSGVLLAIASAVVAQFIQGPVATKPEEERLAADMVDPRESSLQPRA